MSTKHRELALLQQKAVVIAALEDRDKRHKGGLWLNDQCVRLDDEYRILGGLDREAEISLRAVLTIIFDFILHDCIEEPEEDMSVIMGLDERGSEAEIQQILRGQS